MKDKSYNAIRALGIVLICIWHFNTVCVENGYTLPIALFWNKSGTIQAGGVGVVLFFALSGALLIQKYKENHFKTTSFIKKRLARIYIPHCVAYVIAFLICRVLYPSWYRVSNNILGFFISLFGMDFWGELFYTKFNIQSYWLVGEWFTAVIVILYLLFPLLRCLYIRFLIRTSIILGLIFILNLQLQIFTFGNGWFSITNGIMAFWLGMLLSDIKFHLNRKTCVISCIMLLLFMIVNPAVIMGNDYLPTFLFGMLFFFVLLHINYSNKAIEYLCKYNFEIYLVHHRIFILLIPVFMGKAFNASQKILLFMGLFLIVFYAAEKLLTISNKIHTLPIAKKYRI